MTTAIDFARIHDPACRRHFVYRAFDAESRLLYVGCTMNLDRRRKEHRSDSPWFVHATRFRIAGPYNYQTARRIERETIATEQPLYNGDTPGRLDLVRRRSRFVDAQWRQLVNEGWPIQEALHAAVEASAGMAPDVRDPFVAQEWS